MKKKTIKNYWVRWLKDVDWSKLAEYESQDMTIGSQELACSDPWGCEI